jgi:hypothetical protein
MIDLAIYDVMRPMPVFKPEMRQVNRDGLKSQTRRVVDPQPKYKLLQGALDVHWYDTDFECIGHVGKYVKCPYGKAGDYVYMREPLYHGFGGVAYYRDDLTMVRHALTGEPITWRWKKDILTSIFMPKEAARFVYRYESIRVERVQDISRDDAKAEGVSGVWKNPPEKQDHYERVMLNPYVANYSVLWDKINLERGFGWDVNPYVWVLKYAPLSASQTSPHLEEHKMGGEGEEVQGES